MHIQGLSAVLAQQHQYPNLHIAVVMRMNKNRKKLQMCCWFLYTIMMLFCSTYRDVYIHMSRLMTKSTKWLVCAQRRLRSAWASAQSAQADLGLRWAHSHFVGFAMLRLIFISCVISLLPIDLLSELIYLHYSWC